MSFRADMAEGKKSFKMIFPLGIHRILLCMCMCLPACYFLNSEREKIEQLQIFQPPTLVVFTNGKNSFSLFFNVKMNENDEKDIERKKNHFEMSPLGERERERCARMSGNSLINKLNYE